jgi:hypothetical protein
MQTNLMGVDVRDFGGYIITVLLIYHFNAVSVTEGLLM